MARYWSRGRLSSSRTTDALLPFRPARPACCQKEARVPGNPTSTAVSIRPMSIPSSSTLVATRPRSLPDAIFSSMSRRSRGLYPPR